MEDVIGVMDEYYLSKEDWDAVIELGVGDNNDTITLKKISTTTKTNLTKKCVQLPLTSNFFSHLS